MQQRGAPAQGDGFAGITGDLVDGRFSEKEAKAIANQNSKLLRVRLGEPFMARQGSMVAYQGNVDFSFEGGGASKFIKKALTGEGLPLMRCQGQGDVFLADRACDVHLLNINNSGLSISGKNVLAFSASLDWNIERVKGGSIATGGLFNTTLRGTGWVALTTDGPPVVLNAAEAPTFADTNAVVAWSANLQTQLKTSFKASALIGRGSGEAIQVSFYGHGLRDRAAVGRRAGHRHRSRSQLELHGHRAVVDELDLHVRAEHAGFDMGAQLGVGRRRKRSPAVRRPRPARRRSRSVACPSRCWRTG